MGGTNYGTQLITVRFDDPGDSTVLNKIGSNVKLTGIYDGIYLTKISDTVVQVGTGKAEIISTNTQGDGTYRQIRVLFNAVQNITVSSITPFLILRYTFEESNNHYVDMLAVAQGSIQSSDLVIGKCVYSGSTISGFDYTLRTEPTTFKNFLNVEPTSSASMRLMVKKGRVNYGTQNFDIVTQQSPLFSAPTSNSRIDLLYIDTDGTLKIRQGVASASPVAPNYQSRVTLAEVTLTAGQTTIVDTNIKDTRNFISVGTLSGGGVSGKAKGFKLTVSGTSSANASLIIDNASLRNAEGAVITVSNVNVTVNINSSGANGLDIGTKANDTKYFIWLIYNPSTDTKAGLITLSSTAPTLPSGFTFYELYSFVRTNNAGLLLGARHRGGAYFYKTWPTIAMNSGTPGHYNQWNEIDYTSYVPLEIADTVFGILVNNKFGSITNDSANERPNYVGNSPGMQFGSTDEDQVDYNGWYYEFEFINAGKLYYFSYTENAVYLHGFRINL